MNFDNPYWIDLKVTYEFYQTSGRLPEFHKKHVCTKCQYEIPCFTTCDDVRCKCREFKPKTVQKADKYLHINDFMNDVAAFEASRVNKN
jgi:hypothetical protein